VYNGQAELLLYVITCNKVYDRGGLRPISCQMIDAVYSTACVLMCGMGVRFVNVGFGCWAHSLNMAVKCVYVRGG
jgi:hypothetical protein